MTGLLEARGRASEDENRGEGGESKKIGGSSSKIGEDSCSSLGGAQSERAQSGKSDS